MISKKPRLLPSGLRQPYWWTVGDPLGEGLGMGRENLYAHKGILGPQPAGGNQETFMRIKFSCRVFAISQIWGPE